MPAKALTLLSITAAMLVLAACGSSSSSSGSKSAPAGSSSTPATPAKKGKLPSRTYHIKLTGKAETPPGPAKGAGDAVVSIHGKTLVTCWRFAHLKGFSGATFAHIHKGAAGTSGNIVVPLSTGPKLTHKGCASASASLLKAIEKNPHGYYVNIHSTKYPGGAVRAQL